MAGNTNEDLANDLVSTAKKGFRVLLKAAAITLGLAVVGGVALGVAAGAAGMGGLATFGMVVGGIALGGFAGRVVATEYVLNKAAPVIAGAGRFLDQLNDEMAKQAPAPAPQPAPVASAEAKSAFTAAAETAPAAETPAPAAPAATPKAPAQNA